MTAGLYSSTGMFSPAELGRVAIYQAVIQVGFYTDFLATGFHVSLRSMAVT
jgi:hypothetical protein